MTPIEWPWCARDITFRPSYKRSGLDFGAQNHEYGSPHWVCDLTMPPAQTEADRREFERVIHSNNGRGLFGVFDRRCPYPSYWMGVDKSVRAGSIPALTVTGMDKATSQVTVQGQVDDQIHVGDPIAITHESRRYFFKARENLVLDGTEQDIEVMIHPRVTVTGISVTADRIRPLCYFNVNVNEMEGQTALKSTPITLIGTEYWGEVT